MVDGRRPRTRVLSGLEFIEGPLGFQLTPAWRVFVRVAIDRVQPSALSGVDRDIARELFGNVDHVPDLAYRRLLGIFGRESWKTAVAGAVGCYFACTKPYVGGPGSIPVVAIVSVDRPTARLMLRVARAYVERLREVTIVEDTKDGFVMRRPDGVIVALEVYAASKAGANLRGRPILALFIDESWFMQSEDGGYVVTDVDIVKAAQPRLLGPVIFFSTPWPTQCLTAKLYAENYGAPERALVAKAPTLTMRPDDPELRARIDEEMRDDPDTTARERFVDTAIGAGGCSYFDAGAVLASVVDVAEVPAGADRFAGIDPAFKRDAFAAASLARHGDRFWAVDFQELRPRKGAPLVSAEACATLAAVFRAHGVNRIATDIHEVQSIRENFSKHGMTVTDAPGGAAGKLTTYLAAKRILHEGRLRFVRTPRLIEQLLAVTAKPTAGGSLTISSPRRAGSHGDLVSALTVGLWLGEQRPGLISAEVFDRACVELPPDLARTMARAARLLRGPST